MTRVLKSFIFSFKLLLFFLDLIHHFHVLFLDTSTSSFFFFFCVLLVRETFIVIITSNTCLSDVCNSSFESSFWTFLQLVIDQLYHRFWSLSLISPTLLLSWTDVILKYYFYDKWWVKVVWNNWSICFHLLLKRKRSMSQVAHMIDSTKIFGT